MSDAEHSKKAYREKVATGAMFTQRVSMLILNNRSYPERVRFESESTVLTLRASTAPLTPEKSLLKDSTFRFVA